LGFIAVKRHHNQGKSYKGKYLAGLQPQKHVINIMAGSMTAYTGLHGPGDRVEFYILI